MIDYYELTMAYLFKYVYDIEHRTVGFESLV